MFAMPVSPPSAPISPIAPIIALASIAPASVSVITASGSSASGSSKTAATTSTASRTIGASTLVASSTSASSSRQQQQQHQHQQQQQQQQQQPPPASSASSVSGPRRAAASGPSATGSRLHSGLPSVSSQRDITEARQAIDASIANLLDTQLQDRAVLMHDNMRSIANQQRDLGRAVTGLRKANDGLTRLVHEFTGSYKEMGHVQNWAEIQYQNISVLEETMRLVRERRVREEQREERRRLREAQRRQTSEHGNDCAAGEGRAGEHEGGRYGDDNDGDDNDNDSWSSSGSYSGSYSGSSTGSSRSQSRSRSAAGEGEAVAAAVTAAVTATTAVTKSSDAVVEAPKVEVNRVEADKDEADNVKAEADCNLDKGKATEVDIVVRQTKKSSQEIARSHVVDESFVSTNAAEREATETHGREEASPKLDKGKGKDTEIDTGEEQRNPASATIIEKESDTDNGSETKNKSDDSGKGIQTKVGSGEAERTEHGERLENGTSRADRAQLADESRVRTDGVIPAKTNATAMADMKLEDAKRELLLSLPDAPTSDIAQDSTPRKAVGLKIPQLG